MQTNQGVKATASIPCDIAILPSVELAERAITLSSDLRSYNTLFQLSANGPYPHASLYMTQLRVSDIEKVQEILAAIAARYSAFNMHASGYAQVEGYIDIDYLRTNLLDQLQMQVIAAINPIRGITRGWHETLDKNYNVKIVRPFDTKVHYMFDEAGNFLKKFI